MKFNKLDLLFICISTAFIGLLLSPACNNTKSDKNSTEVDTTQVTPTTTTPMDNMDTTKVVKTTGKKAGKISTSVPTVDKSAKMQTDAQGYYNYTEASPVYPGGQSSLEDYINNNLEYPQDALDNGIQGTVDVKFTIDQNGKVGNVQTSGTPLGHGLEDAAMKVVSKMPAWTPGMINGKKVKAWYTLPITYRIEE